MLDLEMLENLCDECDGSEGRRHAKAYTELRDMMYRNRREIIAELRGLRERVKELQDRMEEWQMAAMERAEREDYPT